MYCLHRNQEWLSKSKGTLASISYEISSIPNDIAIGKRNAYNYALVNNYADAEKQLNRIVNIVKEKPLRAYLKQCLAEYTDFNNPSQAQKILMSAASDSRRVMKPLQGIAYHKLESNAMDQARICGEYLRQIFDDPNKVVIKVKSLLESLVFKPETSEIFEESFKQIARYLGFNSQRPEAESNKGPDVLWEVGSLKYFVIECKNGATSEKINKADCNQLNGSGEWFTNNYDKTCEFTPVMIHPYMQIEHAASLKEATRIINKEKLTLLIKNISDFINSLCLGNNLHDDQVIREKLIFHKFRPNDFLQTYTSSFSDR